MLVPTLLSPFLLLLATMSFPSLTIAAPPPSPFLPRRTLAGVSVIDTPIVRAAQAYAQLHCSPGTYNHVMRSWLFGALHLSHDPTLASQVDLEVHAIGLMLHDLATNQSLDAPFLTLDRRFEVDSAVAAADFIRSHPDGKNWPDYRVQRVWDGIALHAEPKFALYKEPDVFAIYWGNELEFSWGRPGGEQKGVTNEEHERVLKEFPRPAEGGVGGVFEFIAWFCRYKPESTYSKLPTFRCPSFSFLIWGGGVPIVIDTFMQEFGELLVPGYSAVGHRVIDLSLAAVGLNMSDLLTGSTSWRVY
ncbi:hypothetical protein B0I37DRAFT_348539 [Chaetomium sp. MPI-CAGE-AT-0009]|nr:hypothetical protein B0I37DRAFT_348539 [Chaetomium sp. MPI-CAGE-AT-0009]